VRPIVPSGPASTAQTGPKRSRIADELWDDRAEADAEQLVGLLFVAAEPLKRSEISEALRIGPARLARACTVLQMDPPRGLRLLDSIDRLTLVSAPACAANVERYLGQGPPKALSQAALEVLAIVAYEQPVTRADIRSIRGGRFRRTGGDTHGAQAHRRRSPLRSPWSTCIPGHNRAFQAALRANVARRPSAPPAGRATSVPRAVPFHMSENDGNQLTAYADAVAQHLSTDRSGHVRGKRRQAVCEQKREVGTNAVRAPRYFLSSRE
jgi:putative transcriptional regulator (Ypuh-like)